MSIKRLVIAMCFCAPVLLQSVTAQANALYAGEKIEITAGFPALTRYIPGNKDQPLVVFIPGAHHTARVSYGGHKGYKQEDFLAYWLHQKGYNFLGISYPIDTVRGGIENAPPSFMIRDWGAQAAVLARQYIDANGLNNRVIVLGWSMAGKVSQSINEAMKAQGIDLDFYVSISATAPLPGLIALTRELPMLESGLVDRRKNFDGWFQQVAANSRAVGHEIVPEKIFKAEYQGDIPVALQGYSQFFRDGVFVADQLGYQQDAKPFAFDSFPLVAMIIPNGKGDPRHAMTDQAVWTLYNANTIYKSWLGGNGVKPTDLTDASWHDLLKLTRGLGDTLSQTIDGNHFFFMGQPGAKATAEAVVTLEERVDNVKKQASAILDVRIH